MAEVIDRDEVIEAVLQAPKYRHLEPVFVAAAVDRMLGRATGGPSSTKAAVKAAKRALHQAYGAFAGRPLGAAVDRCIESVRDRGVPLQEACATAMTAHRSTAMRLEVIDQFSARIEAWTGTPGSIVDLGCGLNPLAIPWLALAPGARYHCGDIDATLAAALNRSTAILPATVEAVTWDGAWDGTGDGAAGDPATEPDLALLEVEVAFALLLAPTLEQQRNGATGDLLRRAKAERIVLSMPRASLSGRRAYARDNGAFVAEAAAGSAHDLVDRAVVGGEELFLLRSRS